MMTSAGLMVSANALIAMTWLLSATWIVKFAMVAVVGWPVIAPVAEANVRPPGKDPTLTVQVYVPLPPTAAKVCE